MRVVNEVRVNQFDRWVGKLQTERALELAHGISLLDVGCGIGMYTPLFLQKFHIVYGLDPSEAYLKIARKNRLIKYYQGYGENFFIPRKFDTITMNMLLEHVDDPIKVLKNCKHHLTSRGRIIIQVPNAESMTRQLGVSMGIIPSLYDNSVREQKLYGHKRVYTKKLLTKDIQKAGLKIQLLEGFMMKPLPNEMLLSICRTQGSEWREKFLNALIQYGKRKEGCANIIAVCA